MFYMEVRRLRVFGSGLTIPKSLHKFVPAVCRFELKLVLFAVYNSVYLFSTLSL